LDEPPERWLISYKQVIDTSDGDGGAVTEIVEVIVSALQKNMSSLEFAFRFFDQKGLGYVSTDGQSPLDT